MKKSACKKTPSHLTVNFLYDNEIYSGTIMNHSENDMFIKMEVPFRFTSTQKQFEVRIIMKDKVLLATARIKRMETMGKEFNGIGVELEYPVSFLNE